MQIGKNGGEGHKWGAANRGQSLLLRSLCFIAGAGAYERGTVPYLLPPIYGIGAES
jgi:hypothetical protein